MEFNYVTKLLNSPELMFIFGIFCGYILTPRGINDKDTK